MNRAMERKPITKKQMRWQIASQVLTLMLACVSIWISKSMMILAAVIFFIVMAVRAF